jgi:hypothetical protein
VWALVSARAEGISIRKLAAAAGLSPSRVHQLVADADLDVLHAALGELRAAGWPTPEDPDSGEDAELDGRDSIADRLSDEVSWLRQCADVVAFLQCHISSVRSSGLSRGMTRQLSASAPGSGRRLAGLPPPTRPPGVRKRSSADTPRHRDVSAGSGCTHAVSAAA